jgi:hypothetical protein
VDAFKRKGNLYLHLKWLKLWGQELKPQLYQISVKYLEVSLDIKVTFAFHLENVTNKATHILWVCKCLIYWLYTKVVIPIITDRSLVWWYKTRKKATTVSYLERLVCLTITGAITSMPVAAM